MTLGSSTLVLITRLCIPAKESWVEAPVSLGNVGQGSLSTVQESSRRAWFECETSWNNGLHQEDEHSTRIEELAS